MTPSGTELKIQVAIPSAGSVSIWFAHSLAGMIAHSAGGFRGLPDVTVSLSVDVVASSNWITNREQLARRAVDAGVTHILWLDDDMSFDPRVLEVLLSRRHFNSILCTNYLIKTEPAKDFVAVGLDGERLPTTENSTGIQPIIYSGFGVSLWPVQAFKDMEQPWFACKFNAEKSEYTTEDLPCYEAARAKGYEVYLDHDASKMVKHWGQRAWSWNEVKHG